MTATDYTALGILALVYTFFLFFLWKFAEKYAPSILKYFLEKIGFHIFRKFVLNRFLDEIFAAFRNVTYGDDFLRKERYCFKKVEQLKGKATWGIIRIRKDDTQAEVKNSLILQVPLIGTYYKERLVMNKTFREAFFDLLRYKIAQEMKRWDLIELITTTVNEENRTKEFEILKNILADKEKYQLFITELRIRFERSRGDINESSKKEFTSFITDLSKGKYAVVRIYVEDTEAYISTIKSNLFKGGYKGVYAFARDKFINKLGEVIERFSKLKNVIVRKSEVYDWKYINGRIGRAQTAIFEKE